MILLIEYGTIDKKINVSEIINNKCKKNNIIFIPASDIDRNNIIGIDPCYGIVKSIFINNEKFDQNYEIIINNDNNIYTNIINPTEFKLFKIHHDLIFDGDLNCEIPEQLLSIKYINPNSKVLEIGSNIGRNTCAIAKILNNSSNLTTVETMPENINILRKNRNQNNLKFNIIEGALSKEPLIQKDWVCIPKPTNGIIPSEYVEVKTFLYDKIKKNYDTLILDCEGAFYYICKDFPEILDGINLVILENDFLNIEHKTYVDNLLTKNGLKSIYTQGGGIGCCKDIFYQVFKK